MHLIALPFLFVFCIGLSGSIILANAYSETIRLVESASVSRIVFANGGDRIVGDFTISNIPSTWYEAFTGNERNVQYAFVIAKVEGTEWSPQYENVLEIKQTAHSQFDAQCIKTGNYIIRFNVGSGAPQIGIGNMRATLNYNVVNPQSNSQADSTDQSGTP